MVTNGIVGIVSPAVLTVGNDNNSFSGMLKDGGNTLGLTKIGSGTLTLTGGQYLYRRNGDRGRNAGDWRRGRHRQSPGRCDRQLRAGGQPQRLGDARRGDCWYGYFEPGWPPHADPYGHEHVHRRDGKEPFADLPDDFNKISPEGLTAFYEISFSNANIQRLNLKSRLDDLRNGSNGFTSNMKVNGATVNLDNKAGVDGNSSKSVVEPILQPRPQNRSGVWVTGSGDFVSVDADGNAKGTISRPAGSAWVSLGLDYSITDQLTIGVMGEYAHTWTSLQPSGHIDVDSGRGGLYATWFNHGIYLNGAIYGGHNNYDWGRSGLEGLANGSTEAAKWSAFLGGGYDFHFGHLSVGPIAALQYTDVHIDDFSEKGSIAPMQIHSDSAESLRSDVGFRAFYQWQIGKVVVEPSLKAAWEHEYKYSALPITAGFAGIPGTSATFIGPSEGHDSAVISAGVTIQWTPTISTYVSYDGQLGREHYNSNAVTGGLRIGF